MLILTEAAFETNVRIIQALIDARLPVATIYPLVLQLLEIPYTDDKYVLEALKLQRQLAQDVDGHREPLEETLGRPLTAYSAERCSQLAQLLSARRCSPPGPASIIITTTTCKRLDLFTQTINSFLACCLDLNNHLFEWLVVDDNSSEEDRAAMKAKYPFMTFVLKDPSQKGHARSMNIIRHHVLASGCPYFWHLEDDFRFFRPARWMSQCLAVLGSSPRYGQCLLNRAYGEDVEQGALIWGGHRRYVPGPDGKPLRYYIHEYAVGESLDKLHRHLTSQSLGSCSYWPHFSLRVGLTRVEVLRSVGAFSETAEHFEREYAYRYRERWLTTYFDNIACTHIGRRTYERSGAKLNAYDLNHEKQFGEAPKGVGSDPEIKLDAISAASRGQVANPSAGPAQAQRQIGIKVYVLNLKRRPDRLVKFRELNRQELPHFHVFDAVDGQKLKPNLTIQRLFEPNDYSYRRGIVGCALSHLMMWAELAGSPMLGGMLVIEDDAELTRGFLGKVLRLVEDNPEADIIFLHHHPYQTYAKPENLDREREPKTEHWSKQESQRYSMGGTTAYWITKKGAANLLRYIEQKGVGFGIDWVMFYCDANKVHYSTPFLAFAECAQTQGADTDIQNVYDGVGFEGATGWLAAELAWWGEKGVRHKLADMPCEEDEKSKVVCQEAKCEPRELLTQINLFKRSKDTEGWLRSQPVHWTPVASWIISVPDSMLSTDDLRKRVWFGYLNLPAVTEAIGDAVK